MTYTIALIGRPNVGKSTLFNRIAGKKLAIVHDKPGVTRDWKLAEANIYGTHVNIIDTAGLEEADLSSVEGLMRKSTEAAIELSDLLLFMVDGRAGVTPMDEHFADLARRSGKKVLLLVNKCEGKRGQDGIVECYRLGLGEPHPISAEHSDGVGALLDYIKDMIPEEIHEQAAPEEEEIIDIEELENAKWVGELEGADEFEFEDKANPDLAPEKPLKVAIVGRPNAGKSTLLNALVEQQRVITGPQAGLTRDSISVDWEHEGRKFRLIDTAGLRRKSKIVEKLERFSADESMRNIRLAQIVVLVVDATGSLDKQDLQLAAHVIEEGRALVLAMNKWDAVEDRNKVRDEFMYRLEKSLAQLPDIPVVAISALTSRNLQKLTSAILDVYQHWNKRIGTGTMNKWLQMMESRHPAPLTQGRMNRLRYITQINTRPPTFALWVSRPKELPGSYKKYIINGIREDFGIEKVPIRLVLRTSKNPYVDKD
jgi:GTP-binding protein